MTFPWLKREPQSSESEAIGVRQSYPIAASVSVSPCPARPGYPRRLDPFASVDVDVGQDTPEEQALAPVRRSDVRRLAQCRRNAIAQRLKVSADDVKTEADVSGDVLEGDKSGTQHGEDLSDAGPEVPRISLSEASPCLAERLARVPARDAIHEPAPRLRIESVQIAPYRRRIQPPFLHARNQARGGECFALDVTDDARRSDAASGESIAEPKIEPSGSGTDREDVDGLGWVGM